MRPRPDAAENLADRLSAAMNRIASMRPRPDAAENATPPPAGTTQAVASMRPRPDAAENQSQRCRLSRRPFRFNEAAARCRGKLAPRRGRRLEAQASMRPRPDAAENAFVFSITPSSRALQ